MTDEPDKLVLQLLREMRADTAELRSDIAALKSDVAALRAGADETNARLAAIERPLQNVIRIGMQALEEIAGTRAELHGRIDRVDRDVRSIRERVELLEARP